MNIDTLTSASSRYIGTPRRAPNIAPEPPAWTRDALCLQFDPELWYPDAGQPGTEAKQICEQCPARVSCFVASMREEDGIGRESRFGIRGGLTPTERWRLSRDGWAAGDGAPPVAYPNHGNHVPGECPSCGKWFKSLRQHRASAHPGTRAA